MILENLIIRTKINKKQERKSSLLIVSVLILDFTKKFTNLGTTYLDTKKYELNIRNNIQKNVVLDNEIEKPKYMNKLNIINMLLNINDREDFSYKIWSTKFSLKNSRSLWLGIISNKSSFLTKLNSLWYMQTSTKYIMNSSSDSMFRSTNLESGV